MTIKGYPDQEKVEVGNVQFATINPVREQQHALDVLAHIFHQDIATDTAETGSTNRIIKATGHAAIVGDVISWTSGALDTREYRVCSVEADYITVSEKMKVAPSNGDGFTIMRPKVPRVSDDGELTVGVTFSNDTNYGTVGANTQRTAAQIGNATGAANFGAGNVGAQTLRVAIASDQLSTLATEATLGDIDATLTSIEGTDFATETTLVAAAAALSSIAAEDFATQTTLATRASETTLAGAAASLTTIAAKDFATQTTLATVSTNIADVKTAVQSIDTKTRAETNVSYTAKGKIAGTSLTGTYATLLNPTSDLRCMFIFNTCDQTILVSLDGGTTDSFELEPGESVSVDLAANGMKFDNAVNISAKHGGVVPTSGSVRVTGIG